MELQGSWAKDEEGYLEFENGQLQRMYETITEAYYQVYNGYLEELDDDEAFYKAKEEGYEMITDYKTIGGKEEFATTYHTPSHVMDLWYTWDTRKNKRDYSRGFLQIRSKQEEP